MVKQTVSLDDVIKGMQAIGTSIATLAESVAASNERIAALEIIAASPKETAQSKDASKNSEKIGAAHPDASSVKGKVTKIAASHRGITIDSVTGWLNVSKESAPFFTADRVTVGDTVKLALTDGIVTGMSVKRGKTKTDYTVESAPAPTETIVKGTLLSVHRGGMSAQLKEQAGTYYNAVKTAGPIFKDIVAGTRVEITALLADGSQPKATAVAIIKDAGKSQKNAGKASKNVASTASKPESITMSLAAESDDGCEHCGAKHGKNGKAIVVLECSMRQYMKFENVKLDVTSDDAMQAYLDWRAARILEVSESRDASVILKGSKYVAPETTTKRRGRPPGSKNGQKNGQKDSAKGKASR